ncbi:MAG: hypothetical protein ACRDN9_13860 [Streptosporangiaceae bacterium]
MATRPTTATPPTPRTVGRLPEVSFVVAAGVVLVSLAYAGSRQGGAWWAGIAFWVGQLTVFLPVAGRLLARGLRGDREAFGLVMVLTAGSYLIKCLYGPFSFEFPDELQHWRTAENILASGHLFGTNYALPVSPLYPGLETVTSAVVTVTGLPLVPAALTVAGVAHLVFVAGLYLFFRQVSGSWRVAGFAIAVYATNAHFQFFDAIYAYQTMALVFLALALHAAAKLTSPLVQPGHRAWWALAGLAVAATVVSHHLTSYVLAALLLLAALITALTHGARNKIGTAALALASLLFAGGWLVGVAPATYTYLRPAAAKLVGGVVRAIAGSAQSAGLGPATPLSDRLLGYGLVLVVALALPIGWYRVWKTRRSHPWAVLMLVGSVAFYAAVGVRVLIPDGAELAGRFFTFIYIPVAYVLAVAAAPLLVGMIRWRARWVVGVTLAAVLFLGGLATGWPPYWERLPGRFLVDGFESGVSPQGVAAAQWTRHALGPGNRIGGDFTSYLLMGTYGNQDVVREAAPLYYGPRFSPADRTLVARASLRYLMVDHRMTEQLPVTGAYFPADPRSGHYRHPLAPEALNKFNRVPGVDRIYDDGPILVYNLGGSRYAP